MKILVFIGTRPEAIKLAPVVRSLKERSEHLDVRVCSTGQHREMLVGALADFDVEVDLELGVMTVNQSLADLSGRLFKSIDGVLETEEPDWVLVQGDTTTVMIAALCCFYRGIRVWHVEAGLRSFDLRRPFPDEMNRKIAALAATIHFAPTERSANNLISEGIAPHTVHVTGNTVVDALNYVLENMEEPPSLPLPLESLVSSHQKLVLVTGHRRESFGEALENICFAIRDIAAAREDLLIVYPVHLNPNVQGPVHRILGATNRIVLLSPLPYRSMVWLMKRSSVILTDSGGIQEEGVSLGKTVLVTREVTERPEGVEAGLAFLVGSDRQMIVDRAKDALGVPTFASPRDCRVGPYGDGNAANRIADLMLKTEV